MTRFLSPEVHAASAKLAAALNLPDIALASADADMIVVDDRAARPDRIEKEFAARAKGRTWLTIILGSDATFVGPTSRAGSACSQCAACRKAARQRDADYVALVDRWQAGTNGLLHEGLNPALLGEAVEVARSAHRLTATDQVWMRDHTLGYWTREHILTVWSCPHHAHEHPVETAQLAGGLIHV